MNITKTLGLAATELKFNDEKGTFQGYASVFEGVDSYGDTIKKGAYLETLKEYGVPKMFYMHNWDMPVGKYTHADEDSKGLWVEGELTPNHSVAADVRAAMLHQTLDGLSIGGMLAKGDFKSTDQGGRLIHKWTKLVEVSPVVFPADGAARITAVKFEDLGDEIEQIQTIRDFEYFLRDASGFSKGAAQALTARVKTLFNLREAEEQDEAKKEREILERIQKLAS